jgi:excinuclease ABC subunit C
VSPEDKTVLRQQARSLPHKPGIYLWKAADGIVVYVGKSVDLRSRVNSYFGSAPSTPEKASRIVAASVSLDFFVTDNEADALILEHREIQRHQPRFNVFFKDDKSYPMIKITREAFPRILVTRRKEEDGAIYLGPYPSAAAVRRTFKLITTLFPIRDCHYSSKRLTRVKLCLSYHIKRCAGPCEGKVTDTEYQQLAKEAGRFLTGDTRKVLDELSCKMETAATGLEFERAALYRDRREALLRLAEPRRVEPHGAPFDEDVVAVASQEGRLCIQELYYRKGRLEGQRRKLLPEGGDPGAILGSWLGTRYLGAGAKIPGALILSHEPKEIEVLRAALGKLAGRTVELVVPQQGRRWEILQMALRNALVYLESRREHGTGEEGVQALAEALGMLEEPRRIEGFDISNTGPTEKVASMVVALDGRMARREYRHFVIRDVAGQDDFASMAEVIRRRYSRLLREEKPLPDLVMVDGGQGQVAAAARVLEEELGLAELPLVGLAKREERIFFPGDSEGLLLDARHPGRCLLQVIRNEAHRFAITHHRKRRKKKSLESELDGIRGIGPSSKKALFRHFSDIESIRRASLEELLAVDGLNRRAAHALFEFYRGA